MESDDAECVSVDILHPEILSKEDLTELLSQRHIKLDHPHATKEDLLEIFHRTITPLPQRLPRANRRGRTIAQVHKKLQAKRRLEGDEGSKVTLTMGFSKSNRNQQSQGLKNVPSTSSSSGTSRLKPPPIVSSKQRTLKLTAASSSSSSSNKTQLVTSSSPAAQATKDDTSPAANSKVNFERKKIVLNKSPVQSRSDGEPSAKVTSPNSAIQRDFTAKIKLGASTSGSSALSPVSDKMRKITLKSPGSGAGSDTPRISLKRTAPMDINGKTAAGPSDTKTKVSTPEEDQSPKKKIKRIAWP
ncbi:putative protein TPRXL [Patiria miniata]|uniref:Ashwin n=1 Tax=Patiria miniata TaxID=46514 RepID=A0A914BPV2_PATMI|nr:putative protein TPRXL [Patiria miniata]